MARMPIGEPRSVPDPYSDEYDAMISRERSRRARATASVPARTIPGPQTAGTTNKKHTVEHPTLAAWMTDPQTALGLESIARIQEADPVGPPKGWEEYAPIWGSGRQAVSDLQEDNYPGALLNTALAASDVALGKVLVVGGGKALLKGAIYKLGSHSWRATRANLAKLGYIEKGQHGHHWLIPQNGWGSRVPEAAKNQLFNIKPMPSAEVHGRIHGRYAGKPQFNAAQRFWYGTPAWMKALVTSVGGRPVDAAEENINARGER